MEGYEGKRGMLLEAVETRPGGGRRPAGADLGRHRRPANEREKGRGPAAPAPRRRRERATDGPRCTARGTWQGQRVVCARAPCEGSQGVKPPRYTSGRQGSGPRDAPRGRTEGGSGAREPLREGVSSKEGRLGEICHGGHRQQRGASVSSIERRLTPPPSSWRGSGARKGHTGPASVSTRRRRWALRPGPASARVAGEARRGAQGDADGASRGRGGGPRPQRRGR